MLTFWWSKQIFEIANKALLTFTLKVYCRVENDDYAEYETGKDNESITSSQRIKNSVYEMDSMTDSMPFTITSPTGIQNNFQYQTFRCNRCFGARKCQFELSFGSTDRTARTRSSYQERFLSRTHTLCGI